MKTSPTQRSLALLRKAGLIAAVTEHWNPYAHIRQDLFGFGDIIAIDPANRRIILVQTTTVANQAARRKKIEALPEARAWVQAGGQVIVHGWSKRIVNKRRVWVCTEMEITL